MRLSTSPLLRRLVRAAATLALGTGLLLPTLGVAGAAEATLNIGAGSPILVEYGQGGTVLCTLGYVAQAPGGARTGITAGHCGGVGKQVFDTAQNHIGVITQSHQPPLGEDGRVLDSAAPDWAVVEFDPATRIVPANAQIHPNGVGTAQRGDAVCSLGARSGYRCGTVRDVSPDWVVTDIRSRGGDSGGPLIRVSDGAALGMLSQGTEPDFGPLQLPKDIDLGSIRFDFDPNQFLEAIFPQGFNPAGVYSQYFTVSSALTAAGGQQLVTA